MAPIAGTVVTPMQISKQQQCGKRYRGKRQVLKTPEAALQAFADEYLAWARIKCFRIPDGFFSWLRAVASAQMFKAFCHIFGGQADNTCFIPISDKYSLALHLELKSNVGRLHGRQKIEAKQLPWKIARTPEEVVAIVAAFQQDAEKLKGKI